MISARLAGALAAALLAGALAAPAGEPAAEKPRALKVGVVDVDRVLRDYQRSKDLYQQIDEQFKRQTDELRKKADAIREEQKRLAADPRDPENVELFKDKQALQLRIAEFQAEEKRFVTERNAAELKAMSQIWDDLVAAVEEHAKDNGFDLILKQQLRTEPAKSKDQFYRNVAGATVLFHTERLDCTDAILKLMNSKHERGAKDPAAPETKTPEPKPPKTTGRKG
jgi:outer membrane protein